MRICIHTYIDRVNIFDGRILPCENILYENDSDYFGYYSNLYIIKLLLLILAEK
jgi:hypothetical protein